MKDLDNLFIQTVIFMGISFICGFFAGIVTEGHHASLAMNVMREEAIKRHVAEWVVDQKTGQTTFVWKEMP